MNSSFILITSAEVQRLAEATLQRIREARETAMVRLIEDYRQRTIQGLWHRLLRKPTPTDKQMVEMIKVGYVSSWEWLNAQTLYQASVNVAHELLVACKYTDTINISIEDLYKIS